MSPVWRSLLFVPANNSKFIAKAHERGADAIILDLEDSVPVKELDSARAGLRKAAASVARNGADVLIRINNNDQMIIEDIDASVFQGISAIMLPKARDQKHVQHVSNAIGEREQAEAIKSGVIRMVPMIETAAAYFQAFEIAAANSRNIAMSLGGEDFALDVRMIPNFEALAMPKQHIIIAARAVGLMPLGLMGSVADFKDLDGIRFAAETARCFGIEGAPCVHPSNVPILNDAFSPSAVEIYDAERIVEAYAEAVARGAGVTTVDGKMIDAPVVRRAETLLARWAKIKARQRSE